MRKLLTIMLTIILIFAQGCAKKKASAPSTNPVTPVTPTVVDPSPEEPIIVPPSVIPASTAGISLDSPSIINEFFSGTPNLEIIEPEITFKLFTVEPTAQDIATHNITNTVYSGTIEINNKYIDSEGVIKQSSTKEFCTGLAPGAYQDYTQPPINSDILNPVYPSLIVDECEYKFSYSRHNQEIEYNGDHYVRLFFEDTFGTVVVVLQAMDNDNSGEPSGLVKGSVWFKNFNLSTGSQKSFAGPCWEVVKSRHGTHGTSVNQTHFCRTFTDSNDNILSEINDDSDIYPSATDGYKRLGTITGLDAAKIFGL